MVAQAIRRQGLSARAGGLALGLALLGPAVAQETSFLTLDELAARLRQNLVWIAAEDIGEHGYGLVVGGDAQTLWVATARHVIVRSAMRGSGLPEAPSRDVQLRFCAGPDNALSGAHPVPAFDAGADDIALLSVPRPLGYTLLPRALAAQAVVGEPGLLLGSNDDCAPVPSPGRVRAVADSGHNLRLDFPGVQGGSSGAPVVSGAGIVGLMKSAEDLTATVHDIADLQRRVQALAASRWELAPARNIPPTDPRAAQIDIAETLNQYLLVLRNAHLLLQQRQIARPALTDATARYNLALRRFMNAREAYDGALNHDWPAPVLPAWRTLREFVWAVHQNFWRANTLMPQIYQSQQGSAELRAQMLALEPDLIRLEKDIAQFLRLLAKEN